MWAAIELSTLGEREWPTVGVKVNAADIMLAALVIVAATTFYYHCGRVCIGVPNGSSRRSGNLVGGSLDEEEVT